MARKKPRENMSSGLWFLLAMKNDDVTMWTKLSKDVRIMRFNNKKPRQSHSQPVNNGFSASKNGTKMGQSQSLSVYLSHD